MRTRMRKHTTPSTPRTGRRARRAAGRRPRRPAPLPAAAARRVLRRWRDRAVGRAGGGGRRNLHQGARHRGQPGGGGRRSSQRGGQRVGRGSVLGGARPRRGPHRNARAAAAPLVHQKGRRPPQHLCREGGAEGMWAVLLRAPRGREPSAAAGAGLLAPSGQMAGGWRPPAPLQPPLPSSYSADLEQAARRYCWRRGRGARPRCRRGARPAAHGPLAVGLPRAARLQCGGRRRVRLVQPARAHAAARLRAAGGQPRSQRAHPLRARPDAALSPVRCGARRCESPPPEPMPRANRQQSSPASAPHVCLGQLFRDTPHCELVLAFDRRVESRQKKRPQQSLASTGAAPVCD